MPRFDPSVIHQHAQELYDRADNLVWQSGITGAIVGAMIGGAIAVAMSVARMAVVPPLLVVAGMTVGMAIVSAIAAEREVFRLRLQAQQSLCQLMIEQNTGLAVKHLQEMKLRELRVVGPAA
jgi:MFS superfamily sulfate permease-like transporter